METDIQVEPCWVITLLDDEGDLCNSSFAAALNNQLTTWSQINSLGENWWSVNAFTGTPNTNEQEFAASLLSFLRNPVASENNQEPQIRADDVTRLNITLVGDVRSSRTRVYLHCLGKLLRLAELDRIRKKGLFQGTVLNIRALLYLPMTTPEALWQDAYRFFVQLHSMMSDEVEAYKPFDSVLFVQERNQTAQNRDGYTSLSNRHVKELMAQTQFHLMIGKSTALSDLKQTYKTDYASVGSASIYFDWEACQRRMAQTLGHRLLSNFIWAQKPPLINRSEATDAGKEVAQRASVKQLFNHLVFGSERPPLSFDVKLWGRPKNRRGKIISPWALYSKWLLLIYFQKYLRYLPLSVKEHIEQFISIMMRQFQEFLDARRAEVWRGRADPYEEGVQGIVQTALRGVLEGRYGKARTLPQVALAAEEIKKACDPAQVSPRLASLAEFGNLEVFAVPEFLRGHYERAQDTLEPEEKAQLHQRIVDTVRAHPMPTALFVNAGVVAVLLSLVGYPVLQLLAQSVVSLDALLQYPRAVRVGLFLLPLLVAFWRYQFRTLKQLRKHLDAYVAANLRHAQTQAKTLVQDAIETVFGEAQHYCEEVKTWVGKLGQNLSYPSKISETYGATTFHREVFEGFEIPGRSTQLARGVTELPPFPLDVKGQQKPLEEFFESDLNLYLEKVLDSEHDGDPLWKVIGALLPPSQSESFIALIGERWRKFAEDTYRDMETRQLHTYLSAQTFSFMKGLSFPPVIMSPGAMLGSVWFEWKYGRPKLLGTHGTDSAISIRGNSLASLAGYLPIERVTNIAIVRTIAESVHDAQLKWDDLSSLFTASTSELSDAQNRLSNISTSQQTQGKLTLKLKNLIDGRLLPVEDAGECLPQLRSILGISSPSVPLRDQVEEPGAGESTGPELEV